jgi:hypothetical protein
MSTLIQVLQLIPALIKVITAIEEALPQAGAGAAKLEAVKQIIITIYGVGQEIWPAVSQAIAILVDLFNKVGLFKK